VIKADYPVLLFLNGLGDHLINLPAIRAISELYPGKLGLACRIGSRDAFFADIQVRTVCQVPPFWQTSLRHPHLWRQLAPCDFLICLNPWHDDSIDNILMALCPDTSLGFFPQYKHKVALDYSKHSADLAFDIAQYLDPSLSLARYSAPPQFPAPALHSAARIIASLPSRARVLAVHTDSSEEKTWSADSWACVLDRFLENHPDFFALIVGCRPPSIADARHASRIVSCAGLPLLTSMSLVAKSDVFVGIDSCMLHVADMFRVPGVGLFGPTNPHEFGFKFSRHRHAWGKGAMRGIDVDEVIAGLDAIVCRPVAADTADLVVGGP
jgi:ADP-heptose:LPS heptosyltransferase